ncbi:hypothetical protein XpiCFBP4643_08500 [Xanthomonas pisi]|uniref:Lipoprotein n=2 Tax=Xanthomonas pisi TaxID=56457 RepID=A0A2S7D4L7_9XANT|nr:hypothetical protein XpiCFBP4643_08500 [Xanthomonas pisi]
MLTPSLLALLLTACNAPETSMTQTLSPATEATAEADVEAGGRGLAKLNPNPRKAYALTVTLDKAPGSFAAVNGYAQYDVSNDSECGQIHPQTGVGQRITSSEPVVLKKVSEQEYQGVIHLDLMLDEDYYGRGQCHWEMTGARVSLKASGKKEETAFLPFIETKDVIAGKPVTLYFWKGGYPKEDIEDYADNGLPSASEFKPELRDELFSVTLVAKEVSP